MAKMSDERKAQLAAGREAWKAAKAAGALGKTKVNEHTIRHFSNGTVKIKNYSPTKAIKYFCTECFCWDRSRDGDPKKSCTDPLCPLAPYRGRKFPPLQVEDEPNLAPTTAE